MLSLLIDTYFINQHNENHSFAKKEKKICIELIRMKKKNNTTGIPKQPTALANLDLSHVSLDGSRLLTGTYQVCCSCELNKITSSAKCQAQMKVQPFQIRQVQPTVMVIQFRHIFQVNLYNRKMVMLAVLAVRVVIVEL